MKRLVVIGAGGHGRVVADVAQKMKCYDEVFFLDDGELQECIGLRIKGNVSSAGNYISENTDFFVAIGNSKIRESVMDDLQKKGAKFPVLIHPSAVIGACVQIGEGSVVMAGAVVNPCVKLGKGTIVNTCCSIDHDCIIGNYSHVSVGSHLAGHVVIGEHTWIGIGATVKNDVSICGGCMIGAGAIVVNNIQEEGTYIGVAAKKR